jgi:(R)-2-hydroxyacyl-CoA dehydratese activating ATPase
MNGRFVGGIDVGSCTTKAVILDEGGVVVANHVRFSGTDFLTASRTAWEECLREAGLRMESVAAVCSTGYGRRSVPFAQETMTEISCHGRGSLHYFPGPITVVDIGGQDNKVIKLDANGQRVSFRMNRKCAAGTGAFLEEMALRLRIPLEELNGLAASADGEVPLGSYCTVFSATEVLEKIKGGEAVTRIVRGIFHSVVKRILEMDTLTGTVVLTGGVIEHNPFLADLLQRYTTSPILIPPHPQVIGAIGAALYCKRA